MAMALRAGVRGKEEEVGGRFQSGSGCPYGRGPVFGESFKAWNVSGSVGVHQQAIGLIPYGEEHFSLACPPYGLAFLFHNASRKENLMGN